MSDVFISHVEEDADIALEITLGLEEAGYTTWCYDVDSIPGPSYLIQTKQAIEQSKAVILVISPHSLCSGQITKEVVRAGESNKEFIPVRRDITHIEFQNRQPEWRQAVGAAASIGIPLQGVTGVLPRIIAGLKSLGIHPRLKTDAGRVVQIREAIGELQGRSMLEKTEEPPMPTKKSELESGVAEMPEEKVKPAVSVEKATEAVKAATKPAVSIEKPTEAVKVATKRDWSWIGIALLCIALGLLAWGTVGTLIAEEILDLYVGMLIVALLFMIAGTYCLRRGMAQGLRTMPVEGRIPNWWWLLPVVLAFIGGIISWAKQKEINWRQAMNMLTLGIILTPIWTIPFFVMFLAPVIPPPPPPPSPAEFNVSNLNIAPNPVKVGEEAVVEISVENVGEVEGTDTVSLIVNEIVEQGKDIIVAGGAIELVSFVISKYSPGNYSIEICGLECVLKVIQPAQLSTGTFLVRKLRMGNGELEIENGLDLDAVVVLSSTEEPKAPLMAVYIQSKDSYTVGGIKDDTYVLYFALGEGWDSDLKKFIEKTSYKRVGYELDFISGGHRYRIWTIPLHSVVTEPVSEDEFPELG